MKRGLQCFLAIVILFWGISVYSKTASEIFDEVSPNVVVITSYSANGNLQGLGSGVILKGNLVASNCHVIEDSIKFQVVYQGKKYSAIIQDTDWYRDICSLKVSNIKAPAVVIGSTLQLKIGKPVYAIGAPKGSLTISEGIITATSDMIGGGYFKTSVPTSPGSSGGGLFDEEGRLIGLTTFNLDDGQKVTYVAPVEWIDELQKQGNKISEVVKITRLNWINKTLALSDKKDWLKMIDVSQQWINVRPNEYLAWGSLGEAYKGIDKIDEAVNSYKKALSIKPNFFFGWYNLGNLYHKSGKTIEAINAYKHAVSINSEDTSLWFLLGLVYSKNKQYPEAIEANRQALRIDPDNLKVLKSLGIIYAELQQYTEAIKTYQKIVRINPEDPISWYSLGNAYLFSAQYSEAIKSYKKGLNIDPESADVWFLLGIAHDRCKQYPEAIDAIKRAVNINPDYVDAWYSLGVFYAKSNQTSKAMEVYDTLKKLAPKKAGEFFNKVVQP